MKYFSHRFFQVHIVTTPMIQWIDGTKTCSWASSSLTETDSSTPLPVLPEGFSQVRFLALGLGPENENLQIRSQRVVSEPDPGFSPPIQLDLWILDLIHVMLPSAVPLRSPLSACLIFFSLLFVYNNLCYDSFFPTHLSPRVYAPACYFIGRPHTFTSTIIVHSIFTVSAIISYAIL